MRSTRLSLLFCLLALLAATASGSASARPPAVKPPAKVRIGKVVSAEGVRSVLVPVRYPIQLAGRRASLTVSLLDDDGVTIRTWRLRERLSSGLERRPEKRRRFTYVHRIDLGRAARRQVRLGARVRVVARGLLDANGDGRAEYHSRDASLQRAPRAASEDGRCSSVPAIRVRPGRKVVVDLPICEASRYWGFFDRPKQGWMRIKDGQLIYRPPAKFRGTQEIKLVGVISGGASRSEAEPLAFTAFPITVTAGDDFVVRALGDSVTAGFGYYSNGAPMTIGRLLECRPAAKDFNDACSSNSLNTASARGKLEYAPDFGLANDISWPAQ